MTETATLAGGCFWCTEAVFKRLKGVVSVTPGYSGGTTPNPSYTSIHTGSSGYAEAIQIVFDPAVISYSTLLDVFFAAHDPTTKDRQGPDTGPEYRSVIFYHSDSQKLVAESATNSIPGAVTEIAPYTGFYPAEKEHLDFYTSNRSSPYCRIIIDPKIQKLYRKFPSLVVPA
jgi:peptide-methionine (S)-S-oxide reductase